MAHRSITDELTSGTTSRPATADKTARQYPVTEFPNGTGAWQQRRRHIAVDNAAPMIHAN